LERRANKVAEKIIIYEVKLIVQNHNQQHIKRFENALQKMVNTSGFTHTELAQVKVKK
jgi:3-dehydroquinate dehydratase